MRRKKRGKATNEIHLIPLDAAVSKPDRVDSVVSIK